MIGRQLKRKPPKPTTKRRPQSVSIAIKRAYDLPTIKD
jgi:hypothetical protein